VLIRVWDGLLNYRIHVTTWCSKGIGLERLYGWLWINLKLARFIYWLSSLLRRDFLCDCFRLCLCSKGRLFTSYTEGWLLLFLISVNSVHIIRRMLCLNWSLPMQHSLARELLLLRGWQFFFLCHSTWPLAKVGEPILLTATIISLLIMNWILWRLILLVTSEKRELIRDLGTFTSNSLSEPVAARTMIHIPINELNIRWSYLCWFNPISIGASMLSPR
jgi:hypothetical protein